MLPPLLTVAPVDKWLAEALANVARAPLAAVEMKTGVSGLHGAFDRLVANPAGEHAAKLLRIQLARLKHGR